MPIGLPKQNDSLELEEVSESLALAERKTLIVRNELRDAETLLESLQLLLDPDQSIRPFGRVFDLLTQVFKADIIVVLRQERAGDSFRVLDSSVPSLVDTWVTGSFFKKVCSGKPRSLLDTHQLPEWSNIPPVLSPMHAGIFVPLKEGHGQGVLAVLRESGAFSNKDLSLAKRFSLLASHAFASMNSLEQREESKQLREMMTFLTDSQEKLRKLALYDVLSGLPNRTQLENLTNLTIANHKASRNPFAFIYIDLNDFKLVNDHHGHDAGDELIVKVASRLLDSLGEETIIGRISGDEFAIVLKNVDESNIHSHLRELELLFERPFQTSFAELYVKASIGAAIFPIHGEDFATLRRRADNAMYRAKASHRANSMVFDQSMAKIATARIDLEQRIRRAIVEGQVECWLQPQVSLKTERIEGFECLARLIGDNGKYVRTDEFIRVASESGLLDDITLQVMNRALARIDEIRAAFPGVRLSFNVAPFQACDDDFIKNLIARLTVADCLDVMTMEITEDAVLGTRVFEKRILPLLRKVGLQIAIDDFGVGYSSLSLIAGLAIDELKIDRSLIRNLPEDAKQLAVLRSISNLATDLNLRVVAEGVETQRQRTALNDLNISLIQGFFYSKPLPIEDWLSGNAKIQVSG